MCLAILDDEGVCGSAEDLTGMGLTVMTALG